MYQDHDTLRGAPACHLISSVADWPNKVIFPIGTKLSNTPKLLTGTFRKYHEAGRDSSQFWYFTQTPGQNSSLQSHRFFWVRSRAGRILVPIRST